MLDSQKPLIVPSATDLGMFAVSRRPFEMRDLEAKKLPHHRQRLG